LHRALLDLPARRTGPMAGRDARAKLAALLVFLIVISTAHRALPATGIAIAILLVAACVWARVPLWTALRRAAIVLPFTLFFALACWAAGDAARGVALAVKSYLSCLAVWLVIATTPLPALLRALESFGAPRFLLMVAQFVYRYLFVVAEEASRMAHAAAARGASPGRTFRRLRFRAAAGALAVLFARSYARAGEVHNAMLARGFRGQLHNLDSPDFRPADAAFLVAASLAAILARAAAERIA
jgi:energy-coupling factor transporter transmembrane protein EcfT